MNSCSRVWVRVRVRVRVPVRVRVRARVQVRVRVRVRVLVRVWVRVRVRTRVRGRVCCSHLASLAALWSPSSSGGPLSGEGEAASDGSLTAERPEAAES